MQSLGKYLIIFGLLIVIIGLMFTFAPKTNFLGHLPGDIEIKKENFTFYFPVVTCIIFSIVLTLFFWLINFIKK
jgi:hypothetical protein